MAMVGNAAVGVTYPLLGAAIAVESNVEANIRISRLEDELARAKQSLAVAA